MKGIQGLIKGIGILLGVLMIVGFAACSNAAESSETLRTPVTDGTYITEGIGKSVTTPITVSTTFTNNTLVDISIGANRETGPILDSVKSLLIPRIIEAQSIGVDSIAGATLSSAGVKQAIAEAIDQGGGSSAEWSVEPPASSQTVKLTGYDVIVVGLGGSGMSAYIKAAESGAKVYGIEWGGKIGGNSATAGGPMAINSEYIKNLYKDGADYVNRDALLKEWYADMEADVPAGEIPNVQFAKPGYPVPEPGPRTPPYQGGPKWEIIKKLIDESGKTVTWLAQDYNFHFARPSGLGYPQYDIVTNYGSEQWDTGAGPYSQGPGYASDDNDDLYKTTMFTRAIESAKSRNPKNGYKLELRARELIINSESGRIGGVKATYRDGTTYEVYGDAVILATGGFIGNRDMKMTYFGADLREEAVHTEQGDGILMAVNAGANTYNIEMPPMVHIAQVKNIISDKLFSDSAKDTLYKTVPSSLLLKGDSLVVGLHAMPNYDLDLRGKRFSNEASMMMGGIAFENWRVGGYYAAIFSNDVLADIKTKGAKFTSAPMFLGQGNPPGPGVAIPELDDILATAERRGNVVRAATLDALAEALGVPAQNLKDTVAQYNRFAAGTEADTEFDKSNVPAFFAPPGTPGTNYYTDGVTEDSAAAGGYTAILGAGYYYGTCGGLDVDSDMQVLNTNRQKIPGLYAAGQDSMGVLFNAKKAYVGYGAAAQGWAITSGRLAGEKAAAAAR